jgi:hypothetical protein
MNIREKVQSICDEAENLDKAKGYSDCTILEPSFQEIIALGETVEDKSAFVKCLIEIVNGEISAPSYLLPYIMRHFKCVEVLKASALRLGDPPDPRYMNFHSDLVHAVEDIEWEDADLWSQLK